jgi:TM2 domain-containing membrane protein YozV
MATRHKNKTLATLLAALLGGIGAHRFYLYGKKDFWAWMYLLSCPLSILFIYVPISVFAGFIEALVLGLTPDEKWDAKYNAESGRSSDSGWGVIIIVILTFALGSTALTATIARAFDLYLTGGSFG